MQDPESPAQACLLAVFEGEQKARAREQDAGRQQALRPATAMMVICFTDNGVGRGAVMVVDLPDMSQVPHVTEPLMLTFKAAVPYVVTDGDYLTMWNYQGGAVPHVRVCEVRGNALRERSMTRTRYSTQRQP